LLYNILRNSDWSCVLNENSIESAVNHLTATVCEAMNLAIPYIISKNSTFPHWFSDSLNNYIKNKINTSEDTINQNLITAIVFFSDYRKMIKTTIKTDSFVLCTF
jgi:hypothetical protein